MTQDQSYQSCIQACLSCGSACNHCASACTKEKEVDMMTRCIQLDMECAAMCYAAAQLMSLNSSQAREACRLCAVLCEACGKECAQHEAAHCQACANACKLCREECLRMAA